jgi:hypothetical protein
MENAMNKLSLLDKMKLRDQVREECNRLGAWDSLTRVSVTLDFAAALAQQAQPDECEALIFAEKAVVNGNYYPHGCEPHLTVIRRMMHARLPDPFEVIENAR